MIKKCLMSLWLLSFFVLLPKVMFAAEGENPLEKMKQYMVFDWSIIDDLGWGFKIYATAMTVFIVWLFVILVWTIPSHVWKSFRAKSKLGDKDFWISRIVIFFILILLMTNAYFTIFIKLYKLTEKQDFGGDTTTSMVIPDSSLSWHDRYQL
jgi:hypothetical protein